VATIGAGVRIETVVGRVERRGRHEAVDEQGVAVLVDLVLDGRMVGRDFDGDVDIVGDVFAGGDLVVAHGLPDARHCRGLSVFAITGDTRQNMGGDYSRSGHLYQVQRAA